MKINMNAMSKLLETKFNDNQSEMARTLGIERTHLNKVFRTKGKGAGAIVLRSNY